MELRRLEGRGKTGPWVDQAWGGGGLGDLGQIQTPITGCVDLSQGTWICNSNFTGTNPNNPFGVALA